MMTVSVRNVGHLPFALCKPLMARGARGIDEHEAPVYRAGEMVVATIERSWERQPCGAVRSDPFDDLIRSTRVVVPASALAASGPVGAEPPWHIVLEELTAACGAVSEINPVPLHVLFHRPEFQPKVTLSIDHGRTLGIKGTFPKSDAIVQESWYDVLYLSVVHEVAARLAGLAMGRLVISWADAQENIELADRLGGAPDDAIVDGYQGTYVASALVSDDASRWVREVDMLRGGGVLGLSDPAVRKIICPVMQAQRALMDESDGAHRFKEAIKAMKGCIAPDWCIACCDWINMAKRAHIG